MKNIYELDSKEWQKYKEEFNKTNFKKYTFKMIAFSCAILMIVSSLFFVIGAVSIVKTAEDSETINYVPIFVSFIAFSVSLMSIGGLIYIEYIHFARWLKIKHNIEY